MITINATGDTTIHTAGKYCPEDILVKIPPSAPATELVTETAACSIVGQCYASNAGSYGAYSISTCYAGANTSNYYAYVMKFRTPAFKGTSKNINFTLNIKSNYHANISLNYALATSDANKGSYKRTYASVSDSNQITSGLLTMKSMSTSSYGNWPLNISASALQAETDYYLFLWGTSNSTLTTVNNTTDHTIMLEYEYEKVVGGGGSGGVTYKTCSVRIECTSIGMREPEFQRTVYYNRVNDDTIEVAVFNVWLALNESVTIDNVLCGSLLIIGDFDNNTNVDSTESCELYRDEYSFLVIRTSDAAGTVCTIQVSAA